MHAGNPNHFCKAPQRPQHPSCTFPKPNDLPRAHFLPNNFFQTVAIEQIRVKDKGGNALQLRPARTHARCCSAKPTHTQFHNPLAVEREKKRGSTHAPPKPSLPAPAKQRGICTATVARLHARTLLQRIAHTSNAHFHNPLAVEREEKRGSPNVSTTLTSYPCSTLPSLQ